MCREIEGDRGRSPASCGFGFRGTGAGSADRSRSIFCESSATQSEVHRTPSVAARSCVLLDAFASGLGFVDCFCKLGSRERVGSAIQAVDEAEEVLVEEVRGGMMQDGGASASYASQQP